MVQTVSHHSVLWTGQFASQCFVVSGLGLCDRQLDCVTAISTAQERSSLKSPAGGSPVTHAITRNAV